MKIWKHKPSLCSWDVWTTSQVGLLFATNTHFIRPETLYRRSMYNRFSTKYSYETPKSLEIFRSNTLDRFITLSQYARTLHSPSQGFVRPQQITLHYALPAGLIARLNQMKIAHLFIIVSLFIWLVYRLRKSTTSEAPNLSEFLPIPSKPAVDMFDYQNIHEKDNSLRLSTHQLETNWIVENKTRNTLSL